jgi:hypothetical protein
LTCLKKTDGSCQSNLLKEILVQRTIIFVEKQRPTCSEVRCTLIAKPPTVCYKYFGALLLAEIDDHLLLDYLNLPEKSRRELPIKCAEGNSGAAHHNLCRKTTPDLNGGAAHLNRKTANCYKYFGALHLAEVDDHLFCDYF